MEWNLENYSNYRGLRIISRLERADSEPRFCINVYKVQVHSKFMGIAYWRTVLKTTNGKIAKELYYDLLTRR